ncbi:hypothetical protein ACFL2A_00720 [Thermodesulfobacteriota bacterium]
MKKHLNILIYSLILIVCMSCSKPKQAPEKVVNDFRNTRWGMSMADVKVSEEISFVGVVDSLHSVDAGLSAIPEVSLEYKGKLNDLNCSVYYGFINNQLVTACYKVSTPYSLFHYYEFKEVLAITFKSLEKEKYSFNEEGEKTYKMNRAIYENEKTELTITAIYPVDYKDMKISEIKKSYVNIGYESKVHRALMAHKQIASLKYTD